MYAFIARAIAADVIVPLMLKFGKSKLVQSIGGAAVVSTMVDLLHQTIKNDDPKVKRALKYKLLGGHTLGDIYAFGPDLLLESKEGEPLAPRQVQGNLVALKRMPEIASSPELREFVTQLEQTYGEMLAAIVQAQSNDPVVQEQIDKKLPDAHPSVVPRMMIEPMSAEHRASISSALRSAVSKIGSRGGPLDNLPGLAKEILSAPEDLITGSDYALESYTVVRDRLGFSLSVLAAMAEVFQLLSNLDKPQNVETLAWLEKMYKWKRGL